jgi:hypothetical protein
MGLLASSRQVAIGSRRIQSSLRRYRGVIRCAVRSPLNPRQLALGPVMCVGSRMSRDISKGRCDVEARQPGRSGARFHSVRRAITGSIRIARRAGKNEAQPATSSNVTDSTR